MKKKRKCVCRQLKKQYKKTIKRQLVRHFVLLSKNDLGQNLLCIPSLTETDSLFSKQDNSKWTGNVFTDNEVFFQNGYISAAVMMLNLIKLSKDSFIRESYINPAMFCFRQYLELTMKDSLLRFRLFRKAAYRGECNIESHDLSRLWNDLIIYIDSKDKEVCYVGNLINELNDVDKGGTLFRYNNFLTLNICKKEQQKPFINVDTLYIRMLQLYRFLEGINDLARKGIDEIGYNVDGCVEV